MRGMPHMGHTPTTARGEGGACRPPHPAQAPWGLCLTARTQRERGMCPLVHDTPGKGGMRLPCPLERLGGEASCCLVMLLCVACLLLLGLLGTRTRLALLKI